MQTGCDAELKPRIDRFILWNRFLSGVVWLAESCELGHGLADANLGAFAIQDRHSGCTEQTRLFVFLYGPQEESGLGIDEYPGGVIRSVLTGRQDGDECLRCVRIGGRRFTRPLNAAPP